MMLHQDASPFAWLEGAGELDLVVTMDDATSRIYSMFLVEEEGTVSSLRALLDVFAQKGLPSSLYTDRGSHYFYTPKAGEAVDKTRLTQVGRALKQLGIEHIPAYSPEARGRSERMFETLQDRLPKELALAKIGDIETANRFIREVYLSEHNARFSRPPELEDSAFVPVADKAMLKEILCIEEERIVDRDNTVGYQGLRLQLPESRARAHYVKAKVKVRQYPDGTLAVVHGPRVLARYTAEGHAPFGRTHEACGMNRFDARASFSLWICGQPLRTQKGAAAHKLHRPSRKRKRTIDVLQKPVNSECY
jgi:hypothetical protein